MRFHLLTLLIVLRATVAGAQAPTPEAQSGADAEFAEGQKAFEQKAYGVAANHFMVAFERVSNPLYLFNAAQAYRLAGDCYEAWEKYNSFVIQVADKPVNGIDRVKEYLSSLKECHDKGPSQDNPVSQPPPQPQPQPSPIVTQPPPSVVASAPVASPSNGLAFALVGGGAVVLAIAVGAQVHEDSIYSAGEKYETTTACTTVTEASCNSWLKTQYNSPGSTFSHIADVAYPVGGLAAVTGLALIYLHRSHGPEHIVTFAPTPQGGEVLAAWRF
jgi:hypothetical protein